MIKKLFSVLLAILLMASFYLYALLREDEETKQTDRWVVAEEDAALSARGPLQSTDPQALADALGVTLPLPPTLISAGVTDDSHHGYYARRLTATNGHSTVWGVRPASASPLIRPAGVSFGQSDKTLMGYPLLVGQDAQYTYHYLTTDQAAFVLRIPTSGDQDALQGFVIAQPN